MIHECHVFGGTRRDDLDINPLNGQQLTNIRTTAKDETVRLTLPRCMSLVPAIA
jgi:GTP-binding protein